MVGVTVSGSGRLQCSSIHKLILVCLSMEGHVKYAMWIAEIIMLGFIALVETPLRLLRFFKPLPFVFFIAILYQTGIT